MKATIDEDGTLKVRPETGLEKYALDKWSEDLDVVFKKSGYSEGISLVIMKFIVNTETN